MNPRTTGMLFGVALLLGAFLYFYEIEGEEGRRLAEESERRLFPGVEALDIEAIELTTSDDRRMRAERRESGGWQIVEPVDYPADDVTLDGVASTLSGLVGEGALEDPEPFPVYGLADAEGAVRFEAGESHVLLLGNKTPVGSNSYVAAGGSDRVFMIPTWRLNSLTKKLDDLRERQVLDFDRSLVDEIEVSWPDGGARLERRDGVWWLAAPVEALADEDTLDSLLSDLAFLRAEGFVDDPLSDEASGLAKPDFEARLSLTAEDGSTSERSFALGGVLDGRVRLARGDRPTLYRLTEERVNDFPRKVVAYRFKRLSDFEPSDAARFEMEFHAQDGTLETVEAVRGDAGWSSGPVALGEGKEGQLVRELARLKGVGIASEAPQAEELVALGLDPARVSIRVFGEPETEGGEEPLLAFVEFGDIDADEGVAARAHRQGPAYRLSVDLGEHLPLSLEALRNRFLSDEPTAEGEGSEADGSDGEEAP